MIEINGVPFEPHPLIGMSDKDAVWKVEGTNAKPLKYAFNYLKIAAAIKKKEIPEFDTYRAIIKVDLWFLLYFVIKPFTDAASRAMVNHPFTVKACQDIENGPRDFTLDVWARFHYKAGRLSEPLLTTSGWKNMGDVCVGDYVFSPTGTPVPVLAKSPVWENDETYRVKLRNGASHIVGKNHLWDVNILSRERTSYGRVGRICKTLSTMELLRECEKYNPVGINFTQPLFFRDAELPIDPYVLGAWLGDGSKSGGTISGIDEEVFNEIRSAGYALTKRDCGYYVLKLLNQLRETGVLENKHIPDKYLFSSIEQRRSLLQGLMDTDGTYHPNDRMAIFVQAPGKLMDDVEFLVRGLGYNPRRYEYENGYKGHVRLQWVSDREVFRLSRKRDKVSGNPVPRYDTKIESIERVSKEPTQCIQVMGGRFLIGRELTPTHNSSIITTAETIQYQLCNPEHSTGIFSFKASVAKDFLFSIKETLQRERLLRDCFADVVWDNCEREASQWSLDEGIVLRRKTNRREASISAHGLIEGMPTGLHFERRVYDDIVTKDLVKTVGMMEDVKDAYDVSQNLRTLTGGHHRVVGTYYHHNDPLIYVRDKLGLDGKNKYFLRFKPATEDGTANGTPVLMSQEALDELKGDSSFNAQQLLDPTPASGITLNYEFLQEIERKLIPRGHKFMIIDPAGDLESNKTRDTDSWAMGLFRVEPKRDKEIGQCRVFIEDLWVSPASVSEAIEQAVRMYLQGGIIQKLGIEKDQTAFHVHVAEAIKKRGRHVVFGELKERGKTGVMLRPSGRNKQMFIESALSWPLNNSMWFYSNGCPTPAIERLKQEMKNFPFGHDDCLNICAYLYDIIENYTFSTDQNQWDRPLKMASCPV